MEFKVFGCEDESNVVYFQLREKEGRINLFAVNKDGKKIPGGHLLRIDPNGVHMMSDTPDLGLPRDCNGRIITY